MKTLPATMLKDIEIIWVKSGDSIGMCQGMALNELNKQYPSKGRRCGYMLYSPHTNYDPLELPEACYYLLERKIDGKISIACFQECGSYIEGVAIFQNSEGLQ